MNQQESEQIWQQLQAHIENYFSPTLAKNVQQLEYKPIFVALLEMPSENIRTTNKKAKILRPKRQYNQSRMMMSQVMPLVMNERSAW